MCCRCGKALPAGLPRKASSIIVGVRDSGVARRFLGVFQLRFQADDQIALGCNLLVDEALLLFILRNTW